MENGRGTFEDIFFCFFSVMTMVEVVRRLLEKKQSSRESIHDFPLSKFMSEIYSREGKI